MTTITIIVFITLFVFIAHIAILLWELHKLNNIKKEQEELNTNLNHYSVFFLIVGILLIVFSISAPFVFTRMSSSEDFNFTETGQIGDTIGGLMSPFINMSAVIVTGLAFYMQYQANKIQIDALNEQKEQFRQEQEEQRKITQLQRFESQFYEMLRQYINNKNNIEIKEESLFNPRLKDTSNKIKVNIYEPSISQVKNKLLEDERKINKKILFTAEGEIDTFNETLLRGDYALKRIKKYFENNITHIKDKHILARHHQFLLRIINFIIYQKNTILDENAKQNYIEILRLYLSDDELEILFYNWCYENGDDWESDSNQLFTKYKLLYYLRYTDLASNDIEKVKSKLKTLINKYKELGRKDKLFEIGDDIDEKFKIYKSNNYSK